MATVQIHSAVVIRSAPTLRVRIHNAVVHRTPEIPIRTVRIHAAWITRGFEPPLTGGVRRVRWNGAWVQAIRKVRINGAWM